MLAERRPDIAAAERGVAEANEQIGIANPAFFPTVTLNAFFGFESSSIHNFAGWQSFLWAVGSSLAQTIFDGGRRRATDPTILISDHSSCRNSDTIRHFDTTPPSGIR